MQPSLVRWLDPPPVCRFGCLYQSGGEPGMIFLCGCSLSVMSNCYIRQTIRGLSMMPCLRSPGIMGMAAG